MGVLALTYEFIITLVILVGAGGLLFLFKGSTSFEAILAIVSAILGTVITFWFNRTKNMNMPGQQPNGVVSPLNVIDNSLQNTVDNNDPRGPPKA